MPGDMYVALVHDPVENKHGQTIVSAITNLDLHDIARVACTYGIKRFYVVTPDLEQAQLAEKIVAHWQSGFGSTYNVERKKALSLVKMMDSIERVKQDIKQETKKRPTTVATSAREGQGRISFDFFRHEMKTTDMPCLLLVGTAWGISPDGLKEADDILEPISGTGDYNHLSVRCATAIIIDRLMR